MSFEIFSVQKNFLVDACASVYIDIFEHRWNLSSGHNKTKQNRSYKNEAKINPLEKALLAHLLKMAKRIIKFHTSVYLVYEDKIVSRDQIFMHMYIMLLSIGFAIQSSGQQKLTEKSVFYAIFCNLS